MSEKRWTVCIDGEETFPIKPNSALFDPLGGRCSIINPCLARAWSDFCPHMKTRENTSDTGKLCIPVRRGTFGSYGQVIITKRYHRQAAIVDAEDVTREWIEQADDISGPWEFVADVPPIRAILMR